MLKNFLLSTLLVCFTITLGAQQAFPTPDLITVDREVAPLSDYIGNGKPTVVAVWATWCQPCHLELDHMKSFLDAWENEYGAQFLAISVDQRHMINRIKPLIKRKKWKYDVLVDTDGKLQSVLGFRSIPQMYVLNGKGEIVQSFTGYAAGREQQVDRLVRRLSAK